MRDLHQGILEEFVEASRKVDYRDIRDGHLREDMPLLHGALLGHGNGNMRVEGHNRRARQTSANPLERARAWQRDYERKKRWRRGLNVTRGAAARSVWYVVVAVCPGVENDNAEPLSEREAI